jgi:hypothetical protein
MQAHWTAFGVGILVGAALGFWMGSKPAGANPLGITGGFAKPFQSKIQRA